MNQVSTIDVLNRLLVLHNRSFAMYLSSARPWMRRGEEKGAAAIEHMAADHQLMVDRIADMILAARGTVRVGEFPMQFTDTHDLSLDYALGQLIEDQAQDISVIKDCANLLQHDPMAQAVAEEALGAATGHLESLEELVREFSGS